MKDRFILNFVVLLLVLTTGGCRKTSSSTSISATEVNQAAAVLLSEIHQRNDRSVKCPLILENRSAEVQQIRLVGTGCSCYGVIMNGERIEKGETIEIPPESSLEIDIDAQAPANETLQKYRASFELPTESVPEVRQLFCELRVYNDLKIFPKVLICDTELGKTISTAEQITIERIFRSESGECPAPQLKNLPAGVDLQELQQAQPPIRLEDDIWKAIWVAKLKVQVAGDLTATGVTSSYAVSFPASDSMEALTSTSKIIRRVRVPVHFPKEIHFGRFSVGQTSKRSLFLSSVNQGTFTLMLDSKVLPENMTVTMPESAKEKYKIDLYLEATEPGAWSRRLVFTTDLETQPEIEIVLNATFLAPETD